MGSVATPGPLRFWACGGKVVTSTAEAAMSYWADKTIPEAGTYRFVLWRPDWNPAVQYNERNYGEVAVSRCVQWPEHVPLPQRPPGRDSRWLPREEDRTTCAMFVRDAHLRSRMMKLGWLDATTAWATPVPVAPAPYVAPPVGTSLGGPVGPVVPPGAAAPSGRHAARKAAG